MRLDFSPSHRIRTIVLCVTALAALGIGDANAHPNCNQVNNGQCYDPNNGCGHGTIEWGPCVDGVATYRCQWAQCPESNWYECNCDPTSTPGGCFLAGTLITLADGSQVAIEQIREFESVLFLDLNLDEDVASPKLQNKPSTILHIHEPRKVDHYFIINGHLKASSDQPVLSNGAWIEVRDLTVGMVLTDVTGAGVPIESVSRVDEVATVYNIAVESGQYIANGVVVHNKEEPLPYQLQPCWDCPE